MTMPNVCSITLQGHLGRDPETRYTASGTMVCNFSVAYSPKKDAETTWFRCQAFGKTAELIQQYCRKGSAPLLLGSIAMRTWQDKEGAKRESWEVTVDRVLWFGPKQGGEAAEPRQSPAKPESAPAVGSGFGDFDDDIPF
jgi:single-strand DNA-binding protein